MVPARQCYSSHSWIHYNSLRHVFENVLISNRLAFIPADISHEVIQRNEYSEISLKTLHQPMDNIREVRRIRPEKLALLTENVVERTALSE